MITLANKLTLLRFILAGLFIILFAGYRFTGFYILTLIIYIIAIITDGFDGYYARKYKSVTTFGKYSDPIADKIIVLSAFIYFMDEKILYIPAWMVVFMVTREFAVTGLRLLAASENKVLAADMLGKIKTIAQMVSIIIFFLMVIYIKLAPNFIKTEPSAFIKNIFFYISYILSLICCIISIISGCWYYYKNKEFVYSSLKVKK